ncbi:MAG: hypothetical protein ABIY62_01995, partial [Ginsengibacter sp.]
MERRFSMNDFEQSLKDQADEFKMMPSKKVWHGIYNDLHPGRRWPSVAMSLLLVVTIIGIGYMNTKTGVQTKNPKIAITHSTSTPGHLPVTRATLNKQQPYQQIINSKVLSFDALKSNPAKTEFAKSTLTSAGKPNITANNKFASHNNFAIKNSGSRLSLMKNNPGKARENVVAKTNTTKDYSELQKDESQVSFANDQLPAVQDESIKERINQIQSASDNLMANNSIHNLPVNDNSRGDGLEDNELLTASNNDKELPGKGINSGNKKQAKSHKKKNENVS